MNNVLVDNLGGHDAPRPVGGSDSDRREEPRDRFLFANGARPLDGYTIKRGIGQGGFGEVYFAVSDGGKDVALKLIRRNLDVELRGVRQCLNLKHPNLLALYDIREDAQGNGWVVMEYARGPSLEQALAEHPQGMPRGELLRWLHGIAAGVAYLHDQGIVHRDLKPGNVFMDDGIVKIGDYGLSKFISVSRRSGQTESVGTVHYMAPEIANGCYGKEIDIYALGIMLYEMVTGALPFEGESIGEVLMKHLTAQPDLSGLPEPFCTAAAAALAKDPRARAKTVAEFLAPLAPLGMRVGSEWDPAAVAVAPPLPPPPVVKPPVALWDQLRQANPGQVVMLVLVALVTLAAFGLTLPVSLPLAVAALVAYVVYQNARPTHPSLPSKPPPARAIPASTMGVEMAAPAPPAPPQPNWAQRVAARNQPPALPRLSLREHGVALSGAMIVTALVAAIADGLFVVFRGAAPAPELFAWLLATSTLSAWTLLGLSRVWRGRQVDTTTRRFVQLLAGIGVGAGSYLIAQALIVYFSYDLDFNPNINDLPHQLQRRTLGLDSFSLDGQPAVLAYMAYFGLVFLIVGWWKHADPLRPRRVSLLEVGTAVFMAWLVSLVWPFPQPWGLAVAATTSLALQFGSPWERRPKLRRGA